jgi:hypothetical protein
VRGEQRGNEQLAVHGQRPAGASRITRVPGLRSWRAMIW